MGKRKPQNHNASCWTCGEDFVFDAFTKSGTNTKGEFVDTRKCSKCREAQKQSGNPRISKYTWRSLKEIDASWGAVKRGQLWEAALEKFARSLPVDKQQQDALIEAMRDE
jgi:uncharacterized Fe-S center protein